MSTTLERMAAVEWSKVSADDVKIGFDQDPSSPAALTMAAGSVLLPDGIYV